MISYTPTKDYVNDNKTMKIYIQLLYTLFKTPLYFKRFPHIYRHTVGKVMRVTSDPNAHLLDPRDIL